MISCIILSAGLSSRFGYPKALAEINGKPAIRHIQTTLVDSVIDEIIVVLGSQAENITPYILEHKKIKVVYNKDYILGQTSSFKEGLKAVQPGTGGVLLLPVDYPFLKAETINSIAQRFTASDATGLPVVDAVPARGFMPRAGGVPKGRPLTKTQPMVLIPEYRNKKGHPPVFNMKLKKEILGLPNEAGINSLIHKHIKLCEYYPFEDEGVVLTFNTREELKKIKDGLGYQV